MQVRHRIFESSTRSWDALCSDATEFASTIPRENLIGISVAASGGADFSGTGGNGVVVVWYWE